MGRLEHPDITQGDVDQDGVGDACDPQDDRDSDGDGIRDEIDDCVNGVGTGCDTTEAPPAVDEEKGTSCSCSAAHSRSAPADLAAALLLALVLALRPTRKGHRRLMSRA